MLDGADRNTFFALRELRDIIESRQKPVLIWAGAGVSAWCGFPTWEETAQRIHKSFLRNEPRYDRHEALRLLTAERFPELFELCRSVNGQRYHRELASLFTGRAATAVYRRFIEVAKQIAPLHVVTTNVDENLERSLQVGVVVQRSDLEQCPHLIEIGEGFVAKLHGSASAVESMVFSSSDYSELRANTRYLAMLQSLFAQSTVVFVGYSLRDKYVLDLISSANENRPLFGDGPHFVIRSTEQAALPASVREIRYLPEPHTDHRSAITVLDIIRVTKSEGRHWFAPTNEINCPDSDPISGYFISDVVPPGTWTSSHSLTLAGPDGRAPNAIIGQGFDNSEIPYGISSAMHDVTVGLVSFDQLHFPLSCVAKVHELVGSEMFWELVRAGIFRFIHFEQQPVVMFRNTGVPDGGDIGTMRLSAQDGGPLTIDEEIRKQIHAVPGREAQAEQLLDTLRARVTAFDHERFNIPSLTRGALLHPSARALLGISDALPPTSIPRWATFPVIRLAHTILAGCACDGFALPATKLGFGSEVLVGAAFAVSAARDWAEDVSGYVVAGRFNTDLGAYIESDPSILRTILKFRDTQPGINLRTEILRQIAVGSGGEFLASVGAGLRQTVPSTVMEMARNQLSGLLFEHGRDRHVVPAVWTDLRNSDSSIRLWRKRSRAQLGQYCRQYGIRPKDLCPCGSGEPLRDCCDRSLSS